MVGVERNKFLCFFFSSRRRHTRFKCDWSSDVCSSDLSAGATSTIRSSSRCGTPSRSWGCPSDRSEERRVGKECRSRLSPYHEKKNRVKEQVHRRKLFISMRQNPSSSIQ